MAKNNLFFKSLVTGLVLGCMFTSQGMVYAQDIQNSTDSSSLVSTPTISVSPTEGATPTVTVVPTVTVAPSPTGEVTSRPTNKPTATAAPSVTRGFEMKPITPTTQPTEGKKEEKQDQSQTVTYTGQAGEFCPQIYSNHIQLNFSPSKVILANNRLYIANGGSRLIKSYYVNGQALDTWGGENYSGSFIAGKFESINDIASDKDGNIYVKDKYGIQKFTANGTYISAVQFTIGTADGQFGSQTSYGLVIDNDYNMYISDNYNFRVQKLSSTGTFLGKITFPNQPYGIAKDAQGNIYISYSTAPSGDNVGRLAKYTSNLTLITEQSVDFSASSLAVGPDNKVYGVRDNSGMPVGIYDTNLAPLTPLVLSAQDPANWSAGGLYVHTNNTLIVGDQRYNRIMFYKPGPRFSDVACGHMFYQYIENLAEDSVVSGYPDGLFRPGTAVTRGAMAKFVKNAYSYATDTSCGNFPDVPTTHVFYNEITTLKCKGIISGYADGKFRPEENVDRGAAMKFVVLGLRKTEDVQQLVEVCNTPTPTPGGGMGGFSAAKSPMEDEYDYCTNPLYMGYKGTDQKFSDVPNTHVFYEFIMAAQAKNVVSGYPDNTFKPTATTDRGAMSKMVDNARQFVNEL